MPQSSALWQERIAALLGEFGEDTLAESAALGVEEALRCNIANILQRRTTCCNAAHRCNGSLH